MANVFDQFDEPPTAKAKNIFDQFDEPAIEKDAGATTGTLGDIGRLFLQGTAGIGGAVGLGLQKTGIAPELGRTLRESSASEQARLGSHLTPEMQDAAQEPLITNENKINPNFGLKSLAANVIPSIPGSLAMAIPGGVLAQGAGIGLKAAGLGKAATYLGDALGFGASEGVFSGASNADQWGSEQRAKDVSEFSKHPGWQQALSANGNNQEAAKEALIQKGESDILKDTAIKTGLLSGLTGGGMQGLIKRSVEGEAGQGIVKSALKGMATEGAQEAPQSYFEQRTTNQATKDYVNHDQDVNEGALNSAALGAVSGAAMGSLGGTGALVHRLSNKKVSPLTGEEVPPVTTDSGALTRALDTGAVTDNAAVNPPPSTPPLGTQTIIDNADALANDLYGTEEESAGGGLANGWQPLPEFKIKPSLADATPSTQTETNNGKIQSANEADENARQGQERLLNQNAPEQLGAFVPTHETSDSTPVALTNDNAFVGANGDDVNDGYITPIKHDDLKTTNTTTTATQPETSRTGEIAPGIITPAQEEGKATGTIDATVQNKIVDKRTGLPFTTRALAESVLNSKTAYKEATPATYEINGNDVDGFVLAPKPVEFDRIKPQETNVQKNTEAEKENQDETAGAQAAINKFLNAQNDTSAGTTYLVKNEVTGEFEESKVKPEISEIGGKEQAKATGVVPIAPKPEDFKTPGEYHAARLQWNTNNKSSTVEKSQDQVKLEELNKKVANAKAISDRLLKKPSGAVPTGITNDAFRNANNRYLALVAERDAHVENMSDKVNAPSTQNQDVSTKSNKTGITKKRGPKTISDSDDLLTHIAKLGGISSEEAKRQGIEPEAFKTRGKGGILRVFHKGASAESYDGMARTLSQYGFDVPTANSLVEQVSSAVNQGHKIYNAKGSEIAAKIAYEEKLNEDEARFTFEIESLLAQYKEHDPESLASIKQSISKGKITADNINEYWDDINDYIETKTAGVSQNSTEALRGYTETELADREREQKQQDKQRDEAELNASDKIKPNAATADLFVNSEEEQKSLDEKQGISDLTRAKDKKRNGNQSEPGEMFPELDKANQDDIVTNEEPINTRNSPDYKDRIHTLDVHENLFKRVHEGKVSAEEFKASFDALMKNKAGITTELSSLTKDAIFKIFPGLTYRYKSEKKASVINAAYIDMLEDFTLGQGFSYVMGENSSAGIQRVVDKVTDNTLDKFAEDVKKSIEDRAAKREEIKKGIENPKTLDDYTRVLQSSMDDGLTFSEARLALTPEQRVAYDSMAAEKTRGERMAHEDQQKNNVQVTAQTTEGQIVETKHTKTGEDLYVVKAADRVDRDIYNHWNATAKRLGGYYSSFKGIGAVPGFQFKIKENAESFLKFIGGDVEQTKEAIQTTRDSYADDKSQSAVERLNEIADRLDEKADESLSRERKVNTYKRAGEAARSEARANMDKAMAGTMRNIAKAINDGSAKLLDRVRQKVQVEMLQSFVNSTHSEMLNKLYPDYGERMKHQYDKPTDETADYLIHPAYTAYRSDLANLGRSLLETEGTRKLGQRLMKVADDVSAEYLKFAKDNLHKVTGFTVSGTNKPATFTSKPDAEKAISRSGYKGTAIVLPFKRGENVIILSPSEAIKRGIWQGDNDKRITLSPKFGAELVEKIGKTARRGKSISVPWQFENAYDKRKRLAAMGIETPAELRVAIREFINLQETAKEADKIKKMERAMIGRANDGLDFFPTPAGIVDEMIDAADIKEGMSVLEPSAGMGHIAERIREAGVEPDVIEVSNSRKELLEAKGFNVVGHDFMDIADGSYDRIIMNPPFGDRRDALHVQHAYELLKPGGRLVAVMGEGVFFGQDKKAQSFREWLEKVGGTEEKLAEGSFLDPSLPVNTSVNARLVVIDKPLDTNQIALFSRRGVVTGNAISGSVIDSVIKRVIAASPSHISRDTVIVADTFADLPLAIREEAAQQGYDNNDPNDRINGVTYQGKVYLVQENIQSELEVEEALLHERIHQILHGNKADPQGLELKKALNVLHLQLGGMGGINKLAEQLGINLKAARKQALTMEPGAARNAFIVDEFLAEAEGRRAYEKLPAKVIRALREFYGKLRSWLNDNGFTGLAGVMGMKLDSFSPSDLAYVLRNIRSREVGSGSSAIRFSVAWHGSPDADIKIAAKFSRKPSTKADGQTQVENPHTKTSLFAHMKRVADKAYGAGWFDRIQATDKVKAISRDDAEQITDVKFSKYGSNWETKNYDNIGLFDYAGTVGDYAKRLKESGIQGFVSITRDEADRFGDSVRIATRGTETTGLQGWFLPVKNNYQANPTNSYGYPDSSIKAVYTKDQENEITKIMRDRDIISIDSIAKMGGKNDATIKVLKKGSAQPDALYSKDGIVQAFYNPGDDTSYFVYDNISKDISDKELKALALHEIGVHALQLGKNNAEFQVILKQLENLKKLGNEKVIEAFDRALNSFGLSSMPSHGMSQGVNKKPVITRDDVLNEVAAYLVQNHPDLPISRKIIAWFRNAVRAIGKELPPLERMKFFQWANALSEEDIIYMANAALRSAPESLLFDNVERQGNKAMLSQKGSVPRFYSALRRAFQTNAIPKGAMQSAQGLKQWLGNTSNLGKFNIKADEVYWSGLFDWLDVQGKGPVSAQSVNEYLSGNGVRVEDVVLDNTPYKKVDWTDEQDEDFEKLQNLEEDGEITDAQKIQLNELIIIRENIAAELRSRKKIIRPKYANSAYVLPNGKDHKEIVVTVPTIESWGKEDDTHYGDISDKNIGWVRLHTHTHTEGNEGIIIDEIQSKRGMEGRSKNFIPSLTRQQKASQKIIDKYGIKLTSRIFPNDLIKLGVSEEDASEWARDAFVGVKVPPGPFITDKENRPSEAYISLMLKKAIDQAINDGKSWVAWTTGEQQANFYDLSKVVDSIDASMASSNGDRRVIISMKHGEDISVFIEKDGTILSSESYDDYVGKNIQDVIGKEHAKNILSSPAKQSINGDGLKIEPKWTASMYGDENGNDKSGKPSLVKQAAMDIAKKMGGKVDSITLMGGGKHAGTEQPALIITPQMRQKILGEGMPLFSIAPKPKTQQWLSWFKQSKMKRGGEPIKFYHGSQSEFTVFDKARLVSNTKHTTAGLGHFFTENKDEATGYGGNVHEVYLSIQNPLVINSDQLANKFDDAEGAARYVEKLKKSGFDGIYIKDAKYAVTFDSNQVKLTSNEDPTSSSDIRFSRAAPDSNGPSGPTNDQANTGYRDFLSETNKKKLDTAIYNLQDRFVDLKRQMEKVVKNGGNIQELEDPRLGEELYHQRTAHRIKLFYADEFTPILQALHKQGISLDKFQEFLHARHAPSRNTVMAERNPNLAMIDANLASAQQKLDNLKNYPTATAKQISEASRDVSKWGRAKPFKGTEEERLSLSGMSNAEARSFMNGLTPAQHTDMNILGKKIDAINNETLDLMVSYGMETPQSIKALKDQWDFYVPLHRDESHPDDNNFGHPIGRGFSVRGSGLKNATGSNAEVTNIMAHIAAAREQMLKRGEKNLVQMRLASFIKNHPDADFAEVGKVPTIDRLVNGLVETLPDPRFKDLDNVVMMRVRGKDVAIVFNDYNPENVRLALSLKNMDGDNLDQVESIIANGTRWLASVNTQYNVVFGVMNLLRDTQGAMLGLTSTPLAGKQVEVLGNMGKALKIISQVERGWSVADPELKAMYERFNKAGGTTGYSQMFEGIKDRSRSIQDELNNFDAGQAKQSWQWIKKSLSDFNTVMENSTRLATFMAGVEAGLSDDQAASIAKNITVNFNRKGAYTTKIGAFYAFFNASMQGTARLAETMAGPKGKQILVGGVALGAMTALLGMAALGDDEWEKIPEFVRERSLILPAPWNDSGYIAIPMPLGFHILPNIGRKFVESAFGSKRVSPQQRLLQLAGSTVGAFNPLGGSDISGMVMPTVLDPALALWRNKDFTGRTIYQADFNSLQPTPGFTRSKNTATTAAKMTAEAINKLTGGTDAKQGLWSPTPDQLDYVVGQLAGGTGRELMKAEQAVSSLATGDELPVHKIPLLGRVYGETKGSASESQAYYDNIIRLNEHQAELKWMREHGKGSEVPAYFDDHPEARLSVLADGIERNVKKLRHRRDLMKDRGAARQSIKLVNDKITEQMTRLNDRVLRVMK